MCVCAYYRDKKFNRVMDSSPYPLPLTRDGFRQWIQHLRLPLVVVLATEQAQRDLNDACATTESTPHPARPSFASLFHPFGCLPSSQYTSSLHVEASQGSHYGQRSFASSTSSQQYEHQRSGVGFTQPSQQYDNFPHHHHCHLTPSCPQNVQVKAFDKTETLDFFPVRFIDAGECNAVPVEMADVKLLRAVEDNVPSIEDLRLVHRSFVSGRQEEGVVGRRRGESNEAGESFVEGTSQRGEITAAPTINPVSERERLLDIKYEIYR